MSAVPSTGSPRKADKLSVPREGTKVKQDKQREKILKTMRAELISCNADVWLNTYSPLATDWPQTLVNTILDKLRTDRIFVDGEGWSPINDAISMECNEDTTFSCFEKITQAIATAVIATHQDLAEKRIWTATARPRNRTYSEVPGYLFLPDFRIILRKPEAQFRTILRKTAGELSPEPRRSARLAEKRPPNDESECRNASDETSDTAVIGEFKLKDTNKEKHDNEMKIAGGATEILYNDPSRRFVPGLTIERNDLRFWMFSRSHIAVSKVVNFHEEPEYLVRFLLYAIFGSIEELGYDVTIQRVPRLTEDNRVKCDYRYSVKDEATGKNKIFQTVGDPISEESAYRIVSRATRVWTVRQVNLDDEGNPELDGDGKAILGDETYALKDVWLYADARMEKDIQEDIFTKLEDKADEARPYFLTIMHDSVTKTHDDKDDITPICPSKHRSLAAWTSSDQTLDVHSSGTFELRRDVTADSKPVAPQSSTTDPGPRNHCARKHVRTVFKECCKSAFELSDFKSFVECLLGCAKALNYMRIAGYVHRDVSAGNCLHYKGSGKLADLEYSKQYEAMSVSEPKTGTPDFMAVEYQRKMWYFLPQKEDEDDDIPTTQDRTLAPHAWFAFHFLHDVESLFWVYFWFVLFRIPRRFVKKTEQEKDQNKNLAYWQRVLDQRSKVYFFCKIDGKPGRVDLIRDHTGLVAISEQDILAPIYADHPELLKPILFDKLLRREYRAVQKQQPYKDAKGNWRLPTAGITDRLYRLFQEDMEKALSVLVDDPLEVQFVAAIDKPVPSGVAPRPVPKRGRDEAELDDAQNERAGPENGDPDDKRPQSKKQKSLAQHRQVD